MNKFLINFNRFIVVKSDTFGTAKFGKNGDNKVGPLFAPFSHLLSDSDEMLMEEKGLVLRQMTDAARSGLGEEKLSFAP